MESDAVARDLAQSVLTDLARRAPDIVSKQTVESLAGWLHRATRYAALNRLRDSRRRRDNERQAMEQLLIHSDSSAGWEQIRPILDEALDSLDDSDRETWLLRYFKNQNFRTLGNQLGISDDAAQKRVSRAVERLREFFAKRGVTVGATGLVVVISANAVQAAPVGLAVAISAAALAGTVATTSTVIAATTQTIAMTTLQKTVVTVTVAALASVGIYKTHQAVQLRNQVQILQQQQASMAEANQRLEREQNETLRRLTAMSEESERIKSSASELLRLRGEVARMKVESLEAQRSKTNDSMSATLNLWTDRAKQLKEYLNENPKEYIPEFKFLTDREWLFIAADAWSKTDLFEQPEDFRRAFESLRLQAEGSFGNQVQAALQKYTSDTSHDFPTDLSQLLPYCEPVVAELLAQFYEVRNTDVFPSDYRKAYQIEGDLMITRKTGVNPDSPSRRAILPKGSTAYWQTTWPKNSTSASQ